MNPITTVINGSECYIPWSALDVAGQPYTPTSVNYDVEDTSNNVQVVDNASSPAGATTGTITLTSTVNTMNALSTYVEKRTVTVKLGIPGGTFDIVTVDYLLVMKPGTP